MNMITKTLGAAMLSLLPLSATAAVTFIEAPGSYTLINGGPDTIIGFGVTNPDAGYAYVGSYDNPAFGFDDVGYLDSPSGEFWGGLVLSESDWTSYVPLGLNNDLTMAEIFGDWAFGGDMVNWYEGVDAGGIEAGETASGFHFSQAMASTGFVLNTQFQGTTIGGPSPVPLPAGGLLLLSGLGMLFGRGLLRRNARV